MPGAGRRGPGPSECVVIAAACTSAGIGGSGPSVPAMDLWEALALLGAGVAAGAINAVVGSGTLVTFPTLLAFGYPPVLANVSNNVGLVPGSVSGAWAYRRELAGQRSRVTRLAGASVTGGIVGAIALLELPESAFDAIVPVMILLAVTLVILQ